MAKEAFDAAIADLDSLDEHSYKVREDLLLSFSIDIWNLLKGRHFDHAVAARQPYSLDSGTWQLPV